MHAVQPPQSRHRMEHHVLQINRQIKQQQRYDESQPAGHGENIQQPPAPLGSQNRHAHREQRKGQAHQKRIDHHDAKIIAPAQQAGNLLPPPRCRHFPGGHDGKDGKEENQPGLRFMRQ